MQQQGNNQVYATAHNQMILLDDKSNIIESCDTLFSTKKLRKKPVTEWLPFIESIFDSLLQTKIGTPELLFSKVEQSFDKLSGFYDFTFVPVIIHKAKFILWTIYDYTKPYTKLQEYQQWQNELEIQRQRLEIKMAMLLKKNVELYQQINLQGSRDQQSLLIQANSTHLGNVMQEFEHVVLLGRRNLALLQESFQLKTVLKDMESYTNNLSYIAKDEVLTATLYGDTLLLKHLLYNLTSGHTKEEYTLAPIHIEKEKQLEKVLFIDFTMEVPTLSEISSDDFLTFLKKDTYPVDQEVTLQLMEYKLAQKLIKLQGGSFDLLPLPNDTIRITFTLPFHLA